MKNLSKKILTLILALSTTLSTSVPAFAISTNNNDTSGYNDSIITNEDIVYVSDDEGNMVPITIIEKIYPSNSGRIATNRSSSSNKVGETRTYTVKISNDTMGLPSLAIGALPSSAKKKAAKFAAKAISKKVGENLIPGLNLVSWIVGAAAWANSVTGKSGIEISIDLEYTETYLHKEGYSVYGWSPRHISIDRY